ncbi:MULTISPECIES: RHS repeat-associated core domain-containing protein [Pseudomonas]|uniref:RHS repeat-associated core domain-containing protein n=1 Tax=Pseudomonas TaxID=286 RepID=UPI00224B2021|nr:MULTISPECIES: RHS repeat-associated core domain-containing protein [unclassified Pseudomonas]MCX2888920.1 RHS repeat-associated core domain-containing protein [Pseudomonas sp. DCB_BI]MDH4548722.1 RHS repeat-associated core domain-containing protein [Pseudomonas sp. BN607]
MPSKFITSSRYSAYGYRSPALGSALAYNAERLDLLTGCYHLGNGYRAYNPALMRFQSADRLSPFGEGGINAYAYCLGDPINHRDPTGQKAEDYLLPALSVLTNLVGVFISSLRFRSFIKQSRVVQPRGVEAIAPDIPLPTRKDWLLSGVSAASGVAGLTVGVARTVEPENGWQTWALVALTIVSLGTTAYEAWGLAQAKPWRPSTPQHLLPSIRRASL